MSYRAPKIINVKGITKIDGITARMTLSAFYGDFFLVTNLQAKHDLYSTLCKTLNTSETVTAPLTVGK